MGGPHPVLHTAPGQALGVLGWGSDPGSFQTPRAAALPGQWRRRWSRRASGGRQREQGEVLPQSLGGPGFPGPGLSHLALLLRFAAGRRGAELPGASRLGRVQEGKAGPQLRGRSESLTRRRPDEEDVRLPPLRRGPWSLRLVRRKLRPGCFARLDQRQRPAAF